MVILVCLGKDLALSGCSYVGLLIYCVLACVATTLGGPAHVRCCAFIGALEMTYWKRWYCIREVQLLRSCTRV